MNNVLIEGIFGFKFLFFIRMHFCEFRGAVNDAMITSYSAVNDLFKLAI